jgi:hypothetical protein
MSLAQREGQGRGRVEVGRDVAGQRERVDDPAEQLLADALGQGRLLEGQVVVDGVVGDGRGLVVADRRSPARTSSWSSASSSLGVIRPGDPVEILDTA